MLAQGQSSSAKRGRLAADVSSGLIFLKKKKEKKAEEERGLFFPNTSIPWKDQLNNNAYSY